jgi:RNA polymerase sigma factor (sigma-70 family)
MADQVVVAEQEGSLDERAVIARAAWRERSTRLYRELQVPATRMVRRAFGRAFDDGEIEDVYANAWVGTLRALGHRHTELTDEEIRRYVLTAVAHHASKELRRRGRRPTAPLEALGEVADLAAAPDERAVSTEDADLARDLLASLPKRRRAVMLLRYGWGLEPAQVCKLVKGLSPRAYRKEITRGIDELTEKLKLVERGDWCADREPLLKAYAAGTASEEERRQARHHLSRCRECSHLVGRLSGHLHSLGGAAATPGALDAVGHGGLHDRLAALADRARAALPGPLGGGDSADAGAALASGGLRGGGAAGLGIVAKFAGAGVPAKIVAACIAGGAAATTCIATGVLPTLGIPSPFNKGNARPAAVAKPARPPRNAGGDDRIGHVGPPAIGATGNVASPHDSQPSQPRTPPKSAAPVTPTTTTSTAPATARTTPLASTTPPAEQQFGVASATPESGATSSTGGSSGTSQEFGP